MQHIGIPSQAQSIIQQGFDWIFLVRTAVTIFILEVVDMPIIVSGWTFFHWLKGELFTLLVAVFRQTNATN